MIAKLKNLNEWLNFIGQEDTKRYIIDRVLTLQKQLELERPSPCIITVGGTNGKGSSLAALEAIYQIAGYKVGSFSSPHILKFNERIKINRVIVDDAIIIKAFAQIYQIADKLDIRPSYFEYAFLAACIIFKNNNLDIAIFEVGLGGRIDAANSLDADFFLLTNINLDHTHILGDSLEKIAQEKVQIMRANQVVIYADENPLQAITGKIQKLKIKDFYMATKDFSYSNSNKDYWDFTFQDKIYSLPRPSLLGAFQLKNLSGVLALVFQNMEKYPVSLDVIKQALSCIKHPGRVDMREVITKDKVKTTWVFDAAHNKNAIIELLDFLEKKEIHNLELIFGVMADKDIKSMLNLLAPKVQTFHIIELQNERAASIEEIKQILKPILSQEKYNSNVKYYMNIEEAKNILETDTTKLVCGSFLTLEFGFKLIKQEAYL